VYFFIGIPLESELAFPFVSDDVVMNQFSKNVKQLCTVFLQLKPYCKTPLQAHHHGFVRFI